MLITPGRAESSNLELYARELANGVLKASKVDLFRSGRNSSKEMTFSGFQFYFESQST